MRILIVGSARSWRIESCFERAFRRAGHQTLLVDDRRLARTIGRSATQQWIRFRADRFTPDFVLLSKCRGLELETVEQLVRGRENAMWYSDAQWYTHLDARDDIRHIAAVARIAARLWVPEFVDKWRALGFDARWLPFAADRDIRPVPSHRALEADVAFLGTGYDEARARFLIALAKHARVRVWGKGWEEWRDRLDWAGHAVEGRDFAAVCSSASTTLGINALAARGHPFYTDRPFLVMLAGGFYLGEGGEHADRMLANGEHCAWYTTLEDCVVQARHYAHDAASRNRVRAQGERFVREHHTYDQRVGHFLTGAPYTPPL
jgi:hypothetical protein